MIKNLTKEELSIIQRQIVQNQVIEEINTEFEDVVNPTTRAYLRRLKELDDNLAKTDSNYSRKLEKLLTLVHLHGIPLDDPLFIILLELDILKEFAGDIPNTLTYWLEKIDREIENQSQKIKGDIGEKWQAYLEAEYNEKKEEYKLLLESLYQEKENVILNGIKESILKTLQQLQTVNQFTSFANLTRIILALSLMMGSLFGAFCLGKIQEAKAIGRIQLTPKGNYALTSQELALLNWAKSSEGIRAKNLYEWNKDWLNDCEKSLKSANYAGISLIIGDKKAKKGYCLLWTKPYSERF